MTKHQKIAFNILRAITSLIFLFAAYSKLTGNPQAIQGFAMVGLPVWFMYCIGIGEVLGAIGLWTRFGFRYAYEGLAIVLAGAIVTTLVYLGFDMAILSIVTAILLTIVVWLGNKHAVAVV